MVLHGKIGTEIEIKAPADKLYNMFKSAHLIPSISNTHIKGVDVHEGDWETHGSVKIWKYELGDHVGIFKEQVELDDENKAATLKGLEGEVFKYYKSFKGVYKFTQKDEGTCIANLWIEYEKLNENVEAPDRYVGLMVKLVQDLDAHLLGA
ncbi:unnamed protein product [Malus baccata var. baccata]|uniref:Bet v I/Major latex protein domain-containing protein n=1 Tax=Malus baccata TaxID=106549 RepID=A0A540KQM4_MALBA|nr:hypothetical protein C1H46_037933 [Malus baccata]